MKDLRTGELNPIPDSLLLPECIYRPGSFSGLMLLYESNFLKFDALAGELAGPDSRWISRARSDNDLYLERLAAEPYTTTLRMTYWLQDAAGNQVQDPNITIRIYHDASQAEALSCESQHHHRLLRQLAMSHTRELSRRWQINMMLNKWLDYLLESGHGFG